MHNYLCEFKISFFWKKCPEVQLLNRVIVKCLVFEDAAKLLSRVAVPLHALAAVRGVPSVSLLRSVLSPGSCFLSLGVFGFFWHSYR